MNKAAKRVLLLGGTGFIGRAILMHLLQSELYEVVALQNNAPFLISHRNLKIVRGSLGSLKLNDLQPEIIIHAARNRTGRLGILGRWIMSKKGEMENQRLLNQAKKMTYPPQIIYCSGSLMYGSQKGKLINELFPLRPTSFARQYIAAERPFLNELNKKQLSLTMLRLPWVIGNGSWFQWNYKNWITEKNFVPVYGNAENMMTFVDVDIIGQLITELLNMDFKGTLNLFHPQYVSQQDWAEIIAQTCGTYSRRLSDRELSLLTPAVREAFASDISLGSIHSDIQQKLLYLHKPLLDIVQKHLFTGENK